MDYRAIANSIKGFCKMSILTFIFYLVFIAMPFHLCVSLLNQCKHTFFYQNQHKLIFSSSNTSLYSSLKYYFLFHSYSSIHSLPISLSSKFQPTLLHTLEFGLEKLNILPLKVYISTNPSFMLCDLQCTNHPCSCCLLDML